MEREFSLIEHVEYGYRLLYIAQLMWHLFSDRTGHSVPLGRHFFIQVLFRVCISVSASAALHCGDPLGQNQSLCVRRPTSTEPWGAGGSSSLSVAPGAQVKCTYEIYLHLVVMVVGPAALLGRKLRVRPIVNSKNDNNSRSSSSSSVEDFLLPFCGGYNPARH